MNAAETVTIEYQRRIDAMTIAPRVQRAVEMLAWARGFVAQYVEPKTYEVKMNETFETEIADGKNNAGAFFFTGD
jgi:thiamine phosphate synthase YjbQ (UPF0047 family)